MSFILSRDDLLSRFHLRWFHTDIASEVEEIVNYVAAFLALLLLARFER